MTSQEELQSKVMQFQQLQEQLETITGTRAQMEHQFHEIENAYEEVEKLDEKTAIYKPAGSLMVKAKNKLDVLKELLEKKETLQIRVESFRKQEKSAQEMLQQLSQQIQEGLAAGKMGGQDPMAG